MADDYVCPNCDISHSGPGICEQCGEEFVNLSDFNLDDESRAASHAKYDESDMPDDVPDKSREEVPEAA